MNPHLFLLLLVEMIRKKGK